MPQPRPRSSDEHRWARIWAFVGACGLLMILVLPYAEYSYRGQMKLSWLWEYEVKGKAEKLLLGEWFMLAPVLYVAIGLLAMRYREFGIGLLVVSVIVVGLRFHLTGTHGWHEVFGTRSIRKAAGIGLTLLLGATFVAAGNHVRKRRPDAAMPAVLCFFGGAAILVACFIRFNKDKYVFLAFTEERPWTRGWGFTGPMAALFLYGALGLVSAVAEKGRWLRSLVSGFGKCIVLGFPLLMAANAAINKEWDLGAKERALMLNLLKMWSVTAGLLVLLGVGLAVAVDPRDRIEGDEDPEDDDELAYSPES